MTRVSTPQQFTPEIRLTGVFFLDVNFVFALAFFPKNNKTVEEKNLRPATYKIVVLGEGGAIKT